MYTQMGNITVSNLRSYNYTRPTKNPNKSKTHKGYTMLAKIEGLEGVFDLIANERFTIGCERLVEGVTLNTWLVFNSLKTSNSIVIKEVING